MATAGLVLGSLLGGPIAEFLINQYQLSGTDRRQPKKPSPPPAAEAHDPITVQSVLNGLLAILACLAFGKMLARIVSGTGFILPDFLFCLLFGVTIRNLATLVPAIRLSDTTVDLLGGVSLSMFLVMALMGMRLVDLFSLAGPLLVILTLQTVAMALYAVL